MLSVNCQSEKKALEFLFCVAEQPGLCHTWSDNVLFFSQKGSLSYNHKHCTKTLYTKFGMHGGLVVECQTPKQEVLSLIPTGVTVLCNTHFKYSL